MLIKISLPELSLILMFKGEFLTNMRVTDMNIIIDRSSVGWSKFEITANSLFMLNESSKN